MNLKLNDLGRKYLERELLKRLEKVNDIKGDLQYFERESNANIKNDLCMVKLHDNITKSKRTEWVEFNPEHLMQDEG